MMNSGGGIHKYIKRDLCISKENYKRDRSSFVYSPPTITSSFFHSSPLNSSHFKDRGVDIVGRGGIDK